MPGPAGNRKKYKEASLSYKSPQSQDGFSFLPSPQIEPQVFGGWLEVEGLPIDSQGNREGEHREALHFPEF